MSQNNEADNVTEYLCQDYLPAVSYFTTTRINVIRINTKKQYKLREIDTYFIKERYFNRIYWQKYLLQPPFVYFLNQWRLARGFKFGANMTPLPCMRRDENIE